VAARQGLQRGIQWLELKSLLGFGDDMDAEVWRLNGRKGQPGEAWAEREITGHHANPDPRLTTWAEMQGNPRGTAKERRDIPATPAAQQWQGWGTALKPAFEPIVVARKPLIGTVAENVLAHGTGALNIDGCRIATEEVQRTTPTRSEGPFGAVKHGWQAQRRQGLRRRKGRWPANVILDESQAAELDRQSGVGVSRQRLGHQNSSGFARTSYATEVDHLAQASVDPSNTSQPTPAARPGSSTSPKPTAANDHAKATPRTPTVKPVTLLSYLVRLVTPPGGTVLEPFAGSGTTLEACVIEGFHAIGIEREADYLPLIEQRLSKPIQQVLA
jgi:hypothetical protein